MPERRVDLPDGRSLVVRPVTPADVDGLAALYAGLDQEDVHRRFFSAFRPKREFFEKIATIAERGGYGLVATVTGPAEGVEEIVGEASYALLPNGDGDLAIAVARPWRGWLGPYLLDALLTEAAARGVPNLEADVLTTNSQMLALVRSRGHATLDHPDGTIVRVAIGPSGSAPSWPGEHDRPRVLVETPGGRWHAEEAVRRAGLQVVACPGPSARTRPCPLLAGERCPLVDGADAIVVAHPRAGDERWEALVDAHRRGGTAVPVCIEVVAGREVPQELPQVPRGEAEVVAFVDRLARSGTIAPSAEARAGDRVEVDRRAEGAAPEG